MTTNVLVRDLDLPLPVVADNRRLEVVADGLPIFGGSQLALDTTLVCAAHRSNRHRRSGAPTSQEAQGTQVPRAGGQRKLGSNLSFCRQGLKQLLRRLPRVSWS